MRWRLSPREARALAKATGRYGPTLAALASFASTRFGTRAALVVDGDRWDYTSMWQRAEGLALSLFLGPLSKQRHPIVVACDGVSVPLTVLAASRLGLDVWLTNPHRLDELARVIPPKALLVHHGDAPEWHAGPTLSDLELLESSRVDGSGLALTRRHSRLVLMSHGTSGRPSPHISHGFAVPGLRQLRALHERVGITGTDTVFTCTHLHAGQGVQVLAACLLTGATLVSAPSADSGDQLQIMRDRGATVLSTGPKSLERLVAHLEATGETPPALRTIVSGSGPLSPSLARRAQELWGPIVMNAYGTTETGVITLASKADVATFPGTVGTPLPGTEVGIVGFKAREDAEGRVWVRGASRTVITDDHGRISSGRLSIIGRLDGRQRKP